MEFQTNVGTYFLTNRRFQDSLNFISPLVIRFFSSPPHGVLVLLPSRWSSLPLPPPIHGIMAVDQHAQLDGFGLIFPFPIRVAAVLVAGMSWLLVSSALEPLLTLL